MAAIDQYFHSGDIDVRPDILDQLYAATAEDQGIYYLTNADRTKQVPDEEDIKAILTKVGV
jgi:hypothetical protein